MHTLSPNEAAKLSGVSRRSIMRAIEAGEIAAHRDNRNQWQIDADALAHWAPNKSAHIEAHLAPTPAQVSSVSVLEERIRGLEAMLTEIRADRDVTRQDRDAWRALAQRPWWKRIAG